MNLREQTLGTNAFLVGDGFWFMATSTLILAAGSMFVLWLGERITDRGVGNGVSVIIMIGIIARLPAAFFEDAHISALQCRRRWTDQVLHRDHRPGWCHGTRHTFGKGGTQGTRTVR